MDNESNRSKLFFSVFMTFYMIGAITEIPEDIRQESKPAVQSFAIPGKPWAIELALSPEFSIQGPDRSVAGQGVSFLASNRKMGWLVSIHLEKAFRKGDAKKAMEYYKRTAEISLFPKKDIRQYELNDAVVREYIVREFSGKSLDWQNVNYYLSHDGYWVDIHISKIGYKLLDRKYIEELLASIRIVQVDSVINSEIDEIKPFSFALPKRGSLIMPIPVSWNRIVKKPPHDLPPTIILRPAKGKAFEIMVTPIWSPTAEVGFNNPDALKSILSSNLSEMLPSAVEKDVPIQEFKGVNGPGYYFVVTDKSPKRGEFRYALVSAVGVGDLLLSVTVLFQDKASNVETMAINMLKRARQELSR